MKFEVTLPDWAIAENKKLPSHFVTLEDRMAVVIRFAELNLTNDTGGPFAAGIFEKETGKCVIIGVCLLYTSPSPRDKRQSRMPSSA